MNQLKVCFEFSEGALARTTDAFQSSTDHTRRRPT
jgi:hypothetical protein